MLAASNNQVAAARIQLMNTCAKVIAFQPNADGESASVVVEVLYPEHGHADILRGVTERDGQARGWTHVHRANPSGRASLHSIGQDGKPVIYNAIRSPEFWAALQGDELLGPNTANCRRPMQPFVGSDDAEIDQAAQGYQGKRYSEMGPFERMLHLTDRIIAAADQSVYEFWGHHPSDCPIRDLEASIRGEDVVRRQPILRPKIEHYDAAIERADIDAREAQDAFFMCTLTNALHPEVNRHVKQYSAPGLENG